MADERDAPIASDDVAEVTEVIVAQDPPKNQRTTSKMAARGIVRGVSRMCKMLDPDAPLTKEEEQEGTDICEEAMSEAFPSWADKAPWWMLLLGMGGWVGGTLADRVMSRAEKMREQNAREVPAEDVTAPQESEARE